MQGDGMYNQGGMGYGGGMGMGGGAMQGGYGGMGYGNGMQRGMGGGFQGGYGAMRGGGMAGRGRGFGGAYGAGRAAGPVAGLGPRIDGNYVQGKLFLGGLENATTKETLLEYCQQWGEVADYVLMEGRGFGFVTYSDPASAQAFLEQREHMIDGKKVEAKAAVPKSQSSQSGLTKKMFVGGTQGDVTDEEFKLYFEQFGEIDDCVILRKPDGSSRGFGFVTYKDEMSVEKCLVMTHSLNGKQVELKRAVKKEEMGGGYSGNVGIPRSGKAPDWDCPSCANKNFGWREVCNRCQEPKPVGLDGGDGGGMGGYGRAAQAYNNPMGMGGGMGGMGGMGGYGMQGMGMQGMGMGYGMGAMGGGMGGGMAQGMGAQGAYGGGYGAQGGYGRAQTGRGAGQNRYRPY